MNGMDIFLGLKYIGEDLIEEAEYGQFSKETSLPVEKKQTKHFSRWFLLVAVIAMALLLVGCTVVYVLRMQNLKMLEEVGERPVYSENGSQILGYEPVNQQILTLAGFKGTPGYQACQEWYLIKSRYDATQDWKLERPEFPPEYFDYVLYHQEMKDQLDALLEKYSLKPLGYGLDFNTVKNMCQALGIEKFQTNQNEVELTVQQGLCYSNGNFYLGLDIILPEAGGNQSCATWGNLHWYRKDCFSADYIRLDDTGDWKEWNYTAASGENVLILCSPSDWRGFILCERAEAFLALQIDTQPDVILESGLDCCRLSDRQLELVADAINFGVQPKLVTQTDVEQQARTAPETVQDGFAVEVKTVSTDGYVLDLVLGITAPEGMDISTDFLENNEGEIYEIKPGNWDYLQPDDGRHFGGTFDLLPVEDRDGKANTQDYLYRARVRERDGRAPFGPGTVWQVHIEDLIHPYYDIKTKAWAEEVLAEGVWNFTIYLNEENGDFREIQLIREPMEITADVLNDGLILTRERVRITSFCLRRFSATIETDEDRIVDLTHLEDGGVLKVVMDDGTQIPLVGAEGLYSAVSPIELEEVDYIQMADDTELPMRDPE